MSKILITKTFCLFFCCAYFTSCSLYRVTIGSGSTVGSFQSKVLDDNNTEVSQDICVKATDTINTEECEGKGMKSYNTKADGIVETVLLGVARGVVSSIPLAISRQR